MKIVVLDRAAMGFDLSFDALSAFGEVTFYDSTAPSEAVAHTLDAEVVLVNKVKMTEEVLKSAKNLKLICEFATGFDNIDLPAARKYGVAVTNVPAYSTESVTLFTVTTVLSLFTHMKEYGDFVRDGRYSAGTSPNALTPTYHELAGKTWGVLGFGNIGKRVADVAAALGCRVIACKKHPDGDHRVVDFDTLLKESDVLTVHCPLNDSTRGIIDAQALSKMKKTAILVNEARGAVLDEAAVAAAVKNGEIAAFGADVYGTEPFGESHPYAAIRNLDNVLLTPHAAWGALEARARCLSVIVTNIESFLAGKRQNRID